jgi:hypothetical protein
MARLYWATRFSGFSTLQLQRAISNREPSESSASFPAPLKRVYWTGERIPVRRWAGETFAQPGRRGRQHWVQHISFERTADGVTVRSYWKVVQGLASRNTRTLAAMGFYDDFCVKFDGRWLIKEKRIYRCDDETPGERADDRELERLIAALME